MLAVAGARRGDRDRARCPDPAADRGRDGGGMTAEPGYVIALAHAHRGRRVFPWKPVTEPGKTKPTKKPLPEHGHLEATTDETVIIGWWKRWPNAYAGWALPDGIGLVDIDDPA